MQQSGAPGTIKTPQAASFGWILTGSNLQAATPIDRNALILPRTRPKSLQPARRLSRCCIGSTEHSNDPLDHRDCRGNQIGGSIGMNEHQTSIKMNMFGGRGRFPAR